MPTRAFVTLNAVIHLATGAGFLMFTSVVAQILPGDPLAPGVAILRSARRTSDG